MTPPSSKPIRVRIAPSPTGNLHIGTARTALFNWLFAKHYGGQFILRIEDTDLERSDKKYEDNIIAGLEWLGLTWDEGPYRQSERLPIYEKYLRQLLEKGNAYYCACTKEELEKEKAAANLAHQAPRYSGKCRNKNIKAEDAEVIRFKIEPEKIQFNDLIRGLISFDAGLLGDIAIAKNLQTPLYNFAVVVDDFEMNISHVIRGEDHIANTPKQLLLQRALGFEPPIYAHLPLILDPDRSKMSKRYSAVSVEEYKSMGYIPEALFNFIALLGWHSQGDQEIFTREELIQLFDIDRVQKAGAIFDVEKLKWMNNQYIKKLDNEELTMKLKEVLREEKKIIESGFIDNDALLNLSKERMNFLHEFKDINDFFFELPDYPAQLLVWKDTPIEKTLAHLEKNNEHMRTLLMKEFTKENLESQLMPLANAEGRGAVLWPLRMALSGKEKSPGPFEMMAILGKDEAMRRIGIAIEKLKQLNS